MYSQRDIRWRGIRLGTSRYNMGNSGCLVTAVAIQLKRAGFNTDPRALANWLNKYNGFQNPLGYLRFDAIDRYCRRFKLVDGNATGKINTLIEVRWYYSGGSTKHWLAKIGGVNGGDAFIDPWDGKTKTLPHSGFIPTGRRAYIKRA